MYLDHGWVPHDAGMLGQSAERVLKGEIPHADFDAVYSGGLSYLHALAFWLFDVRIMTLRYVLYSVFLLWIPAVYYVSRRFAPRWLAASVTILAAVLSIPNYPEAMPTWYLLFVSTFVLVAMFRFSRVRNPIWLLAAGLLVGLSLLIKIVGLYILASLLLWAVFVEQEESTEVEERVQGRGFSVILTFTLLLSVLLVVALVARFPGVPQLVHFIVPLVALVGFLAWREWSRPRSHLFRRISGIVRLTGPVLLGASLPVALFVAAYGSAGALDDLIRGVLVQPQSRFDFAVLSPPPVARSLWLLVPLACLGWWGTVRDDQRTSALLLLSLLVLLTLLLSARSDVYRAVWHTLRGLGPLAVFLGLLAVPRVDSGEIGADSAQSDTWALTSMVALFGLVQFPFSAPIYFLYLAPLAVLAVLPIFRNKPRWHPPLAVLVGFYTLFTATRIAPGSVFNMGLGYRPDYQTERLDLDRARIRVFTRDRDTYESLIGFIRTLDDEARMLALPDSPEVYFLSGRDNPTRSLFDFLSDEDARQWTLMLLGAPRTRMVVVRRDPYFSKPLDSQTLALIVATYPRRIDIGDFSVWWTP